MPTEACFAAEWFGQTTGRSGVPARDNMMYGIVEGAIWRGLRENNIFSSDKYVA